MVKLADLINLPRRAKHYRQEISFIFVIFLPCLPEMYKGVIRLAAAAGEPISSILLMFGGKLMENSYAPYIFSISIAVIIWWILLNRIHIRNAIPYLNNSWIVDTCINLSIVLPGGARIHGKVNDAQIEFERMILCSSRTTNQQQSASMEIKDFEISGTGNFHGMAIAEQLVCLHHSFLLTFRGKFKTAEVATWLQNACCPYLKIDGLILKVNGREYQRATTSCRVSFGSIGNDEMGVRE